MQTHPQWEHPIRLKVAEAGQEEEAAADLFGPWRVQPAAGAVLNPGGLPDLIALDLEQDLVLYPR